MSVGVGSGRSRWMWGPCRGMRDPTDVKGKGSDGEVGGLPTQENKFSLFSPVNLFLHSSSSAEIMQRTDSFRNLIWEPLLSCTLIPRVGLHLPDKGTPHSRGCESDAFGKHETPPESKTRNPSGSVQEILAEISFYISITPLCLNTFP